MTNQLSTSSSREHSVECLYTYALSRLSLEDTDTLRVLFWDMNNVLEWDSNTDHYIVPTLTGKYPYCDL